MRAGNYVASATFGRVDDAPSVHRSAIAMVDEKSVIHPTSASDFLQSNQMKPDTKIMNRR